MSSPLDRDDEDWVGSVIHSHIDPRVWVAVVPEVDTRDGAMAASTSLTRCKEHVTKLAAHLGPTHWVQTDHGEWDCYLLTEAPACPTCGAAGAEGCLTPSGRDHPSRRRAFFKWRDAWSRAAEAGAR